MATKIDSKPYRYVICPNCRGIGTVQGQTCRVCLGDPHLLWLNGKVFYWGLVLSDLHILHRKVTRAVFRGIDLFLLLSGLTGCLFLFIDRLNHFNNFSFRASDLFFWEATSAALAVFWMSVLLLAYLSYRMSRRMERIKYIPRKIFIPRAESVVLDWNGLAGIKPQDRFDVSLFFSEECQAVIERAWEIAKSSRHNQVTPLHLFLALLSSSDVTEIFVRLGTPFNTLKEKLNHVLSSLSAPAESDFSINQHFYQALFESFIYASRKNYRKVQLTDILVGTVTASEILTEILYDLKIETSKIDNVAVWIRLQKDLRVRLRHMRKAGGLRPKSGLNRSMTAVATPYLDSFSEDLTQLARFGYLEPCIGREREMEAVFRILEGGTRENVVLVGPPGVGRRTIGSGIAQRMVAEEVPVFLEDKRLVSLSIARLVSGVSASEVEQRLLIIINEIARSGNIVLFIHDIAHMTGISPGGAGSLDLAGALAEALSKRYVKVIATAAPDDYARFVERSALGQVLEKVDVAEATGDDAIQILEGKSGPIEYRHGVYFSYDAIEKSVQFSNRYLHDRYLPEKAIEILEESATRAAAQRGHGTIVTENDVAQSLSEKTTIPLTEITEQESDKLLHLEDAIHERMINQNEAVSMVSAAIRRSRAEIRDFKRPIVNLLFLGPTGVGKTQLAKTVAAVYFGGEHQMIRLDMSEYQEKSSINRLIGAPPGPGGEAGSGYLTESVRHHPFSLVLLDEIEKAHPDILNIFLQVMDDGRLTDAVGRTIDFTNVILICTSNASTPFIQSKVNAGLTAVQIKNELLNGELQKSYRPEFLNRFDGIIIFKPLSQAHIFQIAELMLREVAGNLENKGIRFKATEAAIEELAQAGFDPQFGARPMRRVIQERVDDAIANLLLAGKVERRDTIIVDVGGQVEVLKSSKI